MTAEHSSEEGGEGDIESLMGLTLGIGLRPITHDERRAIARSVLDSGWLASFVAARAESAEAERDDLRGRLAAVEALADEAKARMVAFPDHPHWSAWDHFESDLRDILRAATARPSRDRHGSGTRTALFTPAPKPTRRTSTPPAAMRGK